MSSPKSVDCQTFNKFLMQNDTFATYLDITITEASSEHAVVTMPLTAHHLNGMGTAHGGAIFSLADMAFAALAQADGMYFVNMQSSINYLSPGRIGPLRGEAKKIRKGRTTTVCEVRIFDSDESLVAIALITGYSTGISMETLVETTIKK